jgi:hypothetical protein
MAPSLARRREVVITQVIAASQATKDASPTADVVVGIIATLFGGVLAADFRGVSTVIHKKNSGFTPWGRRIAGKGPNPVRIVGSGFLLAGLIALTLGLVRAA